MEPAKNLNSAPVAPVGVDAVISASRGTLNAGEPHPMAKDALRFVNSIGFKRLFLLREGFASCAIEGNRMAEVCGETLQRVIDREPVSDRYILGLAWCIKGMDKNAVPVGIKHGNARALETVEYR